MKTQEELMSEILETEKLLKKLERKYDSDRIFPLRKMVVDNLHKLRLAWLEIEHKEEVEFLNGEFLE